MLVTSKDLWAKLKRDGETVVGWHSLVDHSADVAAVVEVMLDQPTIRKRLAGAAKLDDLDPVTCARLAALAFLHDIGKANRGFRARVDPRAERVGHIDQLSWVFHGSGSEAVCDALTAVLGLDRVFLWCGEDATPLFEAVFAHHGRPWERGNSRFSRKYWEIRGDDDPVAMLAPMREKLDFWFNAAFGNEPPLPAAAEFQHAFAGLLMLADWLGSDQATFCFANGAEADRMAWARAKAPALLREVGLAVEPFRAAVRASAPTFATAFGGFEPRPVQRAVTEPNANLVVLEAETGSGKTEAALWRFKALFEVGQVDGLYFALPTRVAASQIFERVKAFRDRVFPAENRPGVVLAVPGQARFDDAEAKPLPGFGVQWSDDPGDDPRARERWAAEHPKRFLAATIAVGTIDQALLGAVRVKHAHLRASALLRHLLVVDEVHASSLYSGELLKYLLVAPPDRPALLQPPLPSGKLAELKNVVATPDALDMLVTSKNHDLKAEVMVEAGVDDWLFALVTLQTSEGFLGAGNYGISRMNGGFANRTALGIMPANGLGAHVKRDMRRLLALRPNALASSAYAALGGLGLLWLKPWDGATSLRPSELDPYYVEICRRVRLVEAGGRLSARAGGSKAPRVVPIPGGVTGDPWAATVTDKDGTRKVFTADAGGFGYRRMVRLMFGQDGISISPLQHIVPEDADEGLVLLARALTRGQGKTEGLHERRVMLSKRVKRGMAGTRDADLFAGAARARVAIVGELQNRVLKPALLALFENGPDQVDYKDDGADRRAARFLKHFDEHVDQTFFPRLWDEFDDGADFHAVRAAWIADLVAFARALLEDADRGASKAFKRRYRARTRADAIFSGALNRNPTISPYLPEPSREHTA